MIGITVPMAGEGEDYRVEVEDEGGNESDENEEMPLLEDATCH